MTENKTLLPEKNNWLLFSLLLDGKGGVNVEFVNEEPLGTLNFKVTLTDGATSARVMVVDENNYYMVSGDLEWVFTDEAQDYRWTEVTAADLAASEGIVSFPALYPSTTYYVHAVAITDDGAVSPVKDFATVKSEAEPEPEKIDYSLGKGTAKITAGPETTYYTPGDQWGSPEMWDVDFSFTVTKGENVETVYLIPCQGIMDSKESIESQIKSRFSTADDYSATTPFTAFGVEQPRSGVEAYDESYGGTAYVLVTVDTDGNYSIADYYVVKGDKTTHNQRPTE